MADRDGEDQEGHQDAHRIDAETEQGQDAQLPDDRDHRTDQHDRRVAERSSEGVEKDGGDRERHPEEQDHPYGAVRDVADHLGEADDVRVDDDVDVDVVRPANLLFEFAGHEDVVQRLAGVGIELEQLCADDRPAEIVGHQPADDLGLEDVLAHLGQALRCRLEVRGNHVARGDTVLDHLGEAHVGREQRLHLCPVHAGDEEDLVGGPAQHLEELGSEDVPLPDHQGDDDPVRATELLPVLGEGLHVIVLQRQQFAEAGVDADLGRRVAHVDGDQQEQADDPGSAGEDQPLQSIDDAGSTHRASGSAAAP